MNVSLEGAFDVLGINVSDECVIDHLDHLVECVGFLGTDGIDAHQFVVSSEFTGANDILNVGEIPGWGAVAEQFRSLAGGNCIGELGDRVVVLAFIFLVTADLLDTP